MIITGKRCGPIEVTHSTHCVYYLVHFLVLLGVHKPGYPLEDMENSFNWLQQTPNAKSVYI